MIKLCPCCGARKPITEFLSKSGGKVCKICVSCRGKQFSRYRTKLGAPPEVVEALIEQQDFKCSICREPLKLGTRYVHVDHDHITKKVRGILCHQCNAGLGMFKDNVSFLSAAISYLEEHSDQQISADDR